MLINLRNALMSGAGLPYDAEVEYLESTGTQWIDTGHPIPADFWFDATIDITGASYAYKTLLGARVRSLSHDYQFSFYGSAFLARYGNNRPQYYATLQTGMTRIRVESGGKLYINESFVEQLGVDSPSALNMYIFALNNNGAVSQQAQYIRLYSLKYGGQNENHDYIPVRRGTVGYLYDRVSGKLFGNAGTGDFVLGPDVVPVEYIESHGTEYIDTGVVCQNSNVTAFEFKFAYTKYPSTRYVWGSDKGANQGINNLGHYFSGLVDSNVVIPLQTYHTGRSEVHPSSIVKAYIDGTQFRNNTGSAPYTNPFCIFALGGFTTQRIGGLRISSCKVLVDSTLIHDFIPVRIGTDATSWEGAMMDVLTRRIYRNAGNGAFTYGNDLKYPIPAA